MWPKNNKKYNEGYEGKSIKRNKESRLDKYKEEIKVKSELPGSTIKGTYEYFISIQKILKKISRIINFIQDMKLNLENNYNLIGKKI